MEPNFTFNPWSSAVHVHPPLLFTPSFIANPEQYAPEMQLQYPPRKCIRSSCNNPLPPAWAWKLCAMCQEKNRVLNKERKGAKKLASQQGRSVRDPSVFGINQPLVTTGGTGDPHPSQIVQRARPAVASTSARQVAHEPPQIPVVGPHMMQPVEHRCTSCSVKIPPSTIPALCIACNFRQPQPLPQPQSRPQGRKRKSGEPAKLAPPMQLTWPTAQLQVFPNSGYVVPFMSTQFGLGMSMVTGNAGGGGSTGAAMAHFNSKGELIEPGDEAGFGFEVPKPERVANTNNIPAPVTPDLVDAPSLFRPSPTPVAGPSVPYKTTPESKSQPMSSPFTEPNNHIVSAAGPSQFSSPDPQSSLVVSTPHLDRTSKSSTSNHVTRDAPDISARHSNRSTSTVLSNPAPKNDTVVSVLSTRNGHESTSQIELICETSDCKNPIPVDSMWPRCDMCSLKRWKERMRGGKESVTKRTADSGIKIRIPSTRKVHSQILKSDEEQRNVATGTEPEKMTEQTSEECTKRKRKRARSEVDENDISAVKLGSDGFVAKKIGADAERADRDLSIDAAMVREEGISNANDIAVNETEDVRNSCVSLAVNSLKDVVVQEAFPVVNDSDMMENTESAEAASVVVDEVFPFNMVESEQHHIGSPETAHGDPDKALLLTKAPDVAETDSHLDETLPSDRPSDMAETDDHQVENTESLSRSEVPKVCSLPEPDNSNGTTNDSEPSMRDETHETQNKPDLVEDNSSYISREEEYRDVDDWSDMSELTPMEESTDSGETEIDPVESDKEDARGVGPSRVNARSKSAPRKAYSKAGSHLQGVVVDGILRRKCSITTCTNPIPEDYRWKLCEPCRVRRREYQRERVARGGMGRRKDSEMWRVSSNGIQIDQDSDKLQDQYHPHTLNPQLLAIPAYPSGRICSIKKCSNCLPPLSEYRWKLCEPCRLRTRLQSRRRWNERYAAAAKRGEGDGEEDADVDGTESEREGNERSDLPVGSSTNVNWKYYKKKRHGLADDEQVGDQSQERQKDDASSEAANTSVPGPSHRICATRYCGILVHPNSTSRYCGTCSAETLQHEGDDESSEPDVPLSRTVRRARKKRSGSATKSRRKTQTIQSSLTSARHNELPSRPTAYGYSPCPSHFPLFQHFGSLLKTFQARLSSFLQAQGHYMRFRFKEAGTPDMRDNLAPVVFEFDGEYSIVAYSWNDPRQVQAWVESTAKSIEKALGIAFSVLGTFMAQGGAIVTRFQCIHDILVPVLVPSPSITSSVDNISSDNNPASETAGVLVKRMAGELELTVAADRTHRFIPGQKIIVRFRMIG